MKIIEQRDHYKKLFLENIFWMYIYFWTIIGISFSFILFFLINSRTINIWFLVIQMVFLFLGVFGMISTIKYRDKNLK